MPAPLDQLTEEYFPAHQAPLEGRFVPSPYNFEFTGEDALRLTVHNSLTGVVVAVHYRMHRPKEQAHASAQRFTPATDRSASVAEFPIGEGYLLNVTVFASSGSPRRGQTFARLQVIRGRGTAATVLGTIVQGYITGNQDRAWPGSPIEGSLEGDGHVRAVVGTTPAAGVTISEAVPAGARWRLQSIHTQFNTSAAVATRRLYLFVNAGDGAQHGMSWQTQTQVASNERYYQWMRNLSRENNALEVNFNEGHSDITMLAGHLLRVNVSSLQAADQFSVVRFIVDEWLEAQ